MYINYEQANVLIMNDKCMVSALLISNAHACAHFLSCDTVRLNNNMCHYDLMHNNSQGFIYWGMNSPPSVPLTSTSKVSCNI